MKTILITGASSGIGEATAKHFQANGWNVIATMRTPDPAGDLGALDNVHVTRLDVTDPGSIAEAVTAGLTRFGRIDALLNNAGYGAYGALEAFSMERIRRQFDTNVIATRMVQEMFTFRNAGRASALAIILLIAVTPVMVYNVRNMRTGRS